MTSKAKEIIDKRLTGADCCGVREPPYCNTPVSNVIWPVLHCIIGIGNQILKYLIDYIETNIEKILPIDVQLRESIPRLDAMISQARTVHDSLDAANDFGK